MSNKEKWQLIGLQVANGLLHILTLGLSKLQTIVANKITYLKNK